MSNANRCNALIPDYWKRAWLASALKQNDTGDLPRYNIEELQELAATPLQGELATLNRLKGGAPEAYYYWLKIAQLD